MSQLIHTVFLIYLHINTDEVYKVLGVISHIKTLKNKIITIYVKDGSINRYYYHYLGGKGKMTHVMLM